jgi:FKBP-type peptidyl-prolyl cis-trans isomerase SlyD
MKASPDCVVSFHYVLTVDGQVRENSRDRDQPLQVLLGRGQLVSGMEKALEGHAEGETFSVELAPEDGYGPRREGRVQRLSKKYFGKGARLVTGAAVTLRRKDGGVVQGSVHKVGMTTVDVDLNHPLAGKTLHFDIEMVEVREASEDELAHGHAHGPGGHEH